MDSIEQSLPAPAYTGPFAFFRRHWNGDYPLGRSYWVNNVLLSLGAVLLGLMVVRWLSDRAQYRYSSIAIMATMVLAYTCSLWAMRGTWMSASKHTSRGGHRGWAITAQVMLCLGLVKAAVDVRQLWPQMKEHWQIATGEVFGSNARIELRAGGQSLLLAGGIHEGSAEQLEAALRANPGVRTVVFSSPGGWIREGERLADVVRSRGLNTYVEGGCASACTIAFLAGKDRAAAPNARIGFHAGRRVGGGGPSASARDADELRAVYRRAGVEGAFVTRVLSTPYEGMWFPTVDEMLAAKVLTRRSIGGETAAMATAFKSREAWAATLKQTEAFAALEERAPQDFARILDAAWAKAQAGATDTEVSMAARAQVTPIVSRLLPQTSDATLIAYHQLLVKEFEVLLEKDPAVCVEAAFPTGKPVNLMSLLPKEMVAEELRLLAQVIREADPKRVKRPAQSELALVAGRAARKMTDQQRDIFADETSRAKASPAAVCGATLVFFKGLGDIPLAERGRGLRVLFSG
ncbi:hypothetical protein [Mitsuaria sp. 7]|uniref:COG3904 family protein n=1 Tax=Mitsuaria sp. 7 TaxID=1658665 RepID=UPI0007DDACA7|nr:hypothetical protein [Mitsuaria sp. 7]ANH68184.1 hypothetical protein ABE85_12530 [Mitsuaria sp. 7]